MKIKPAILPLLESTLTIMAQIFLSQKISKTNHAGNKNASLAQIQPVLNTRLELKGEHFPAHAIKAYRH